MTSLNLSLDEIKENLLTLLAQKAYRFGDFSLASGKKSSHYVNCKPVSLSGKGLLLISSLLLKQINESDFGVAGLTLGADPLGALTSGPHADHGGPGRAPRGYGHGAVLQRGTRVLQTERQQGGADRGLGRA